MSRGVRLLWAEASGAEHFRDFAALSEAREAVTPAMVDWVIVARTVPGRHGVVGTVLDSVEEAGQ